MNEKAYPRSQFRDIPEGVLRLLKSLESYKGQGSWTRDYLKLAVSLAKSEPFTIILFAEPLASEHWRYKNFSTISVLDQEGGEVRTFYPNLSNNQIKKDF